MALLVAAFAWNTGLGISHVVVPLYAAYLGFSPVAIGLLFGLPVLAQIGLSLVGGVTTDRWGGRRVLLVAMWFTLSGTLLLLVAQSYMPLMLAQLMFMVGRGLYWPASETLVSELAGSRHIQFGRLNAAVNLGQIAGTAGVGLLLATAGFVAVFLVFGALVVVALAAVQRLPRQPGSGAHNGGALFAGMGPLLRNPRIHLALGCAFLSAQPVSICQSFYPLLLEHLSFGEGWIGPMLALRPAGSALAMLLLASLLGGPRAFAWALASSGAVAGSLLAAPHLTQLVPAATAVALLGMGSALSMLYYQLAASDATAPELRGSALAIAGAGWGISHLCSPVIMGFIVQWRDLETAFTVWGWVMFALLVGLAWLHRRAQRAPIPGSPLAGGP